MHGDAEKFPANLEFVMHKWLLALSLSYAATAAQADEFAAKVIVVLDGDTVMVVRSCNGSKPAATGVHMPPCGDGRPLRIRLAEIDAPEKAQPGGAESKKSLVGMVLKKQVSVNAQTVDKYGRLVAHLKVDGVNVNEEQVRRGMAWEYSNYHRNKTYIALQNEAQKARRGLWARTDPVPPWEWRKLHAAEVPANAQNPSRSTSTRATGDFTCGNKRNCAQMRSCAEARFYLTQCGIKSLDGNGDGVPCESLCSMTK